MLNCVQYILNAKGVQQVFMHVQLGKFTGCEATSYTAIYWLSTWCTNYYLFI